MKQRMVGILVDPSIYKKIPSGRTRYEKIRFYDAAGKQCGVTPCYFRLRDIRLSERRVRAYVRQGEGYKSRWLPIPGVIHNRALTLGLSSRRKINRLVRRGVIVFNRRTRYGKTRIHRVLAKHPELRSHLPDTKVATRKNLVRMMRKHDALILKPNSSSIGIGIMKLEKKGRIWIFSFPLTRLGKRWKHIRFRRRLPAALLQKIKKRKYLVQEKIALATYRDCPFDLRVSVQRDQTGQWQVTGINGKVAAKNKFVTNVAQGGKVYAPDVLLQGYPEWNPEEIMRRVEELSLKIADHLGKYLPGLADLGLDIGLDQQGHPLFIECNARDLRYSFQKGKMRKEWKQTFMNPVAYASAIISALEQKNQKRKPDRAEKIGRKEEPAGPDAGTRPAEKNRL